MTRLVTRSFVLLAMCLASRFASAQGPTPPVAASPPPTSLPGPSPQAPSPGPDSPEEHGHAGFVFGVSVAYAAPAGNATSVAGDNLAATFGYQIPVTIDLGFDILPSLFVGAYGTFADGGPGNGITLTCMQLNCAESSFRGGLVVEYRFFPGGRFEPWIGYGAGYDVSMATIRSISDQFGNTQPLSSKNWRGWDVAHLRAGMDFLSDPYSAAGIFVDVGIGQFNSTWSQLGTQPGIDRAIADPTTHQWFTFGARWTFMP